MKAEPQDPQEKSERATPSPLMPPPCVTVKAEVKQEEPENGKDDNEEDDEADEADKPCTKMTMRLRSNLNNPQCVCGPQQCPSVAQNRNNN